MHSLTEMDLIGPYELGVEVWNKIFLAMEKAAMNLGLGFHYP